MTDNDLMPFGKHKGTKMANVPAEYLIWLWGEFKKAGNIYGSSKSVYDYIKDNLDVLEKEAG